jgi:diketogulonate reductase-like aldo/keto reductase
MSAGNRTVSWKIGEAVVVDDTFIRQDWHAGAVGDFYSLQVAFCHPCENSQRALYDDQRVRCGAPAASTTDGACLASAEGTCAAAPQAGVTLAKAAAAQTLRASVPFAAAALWAVSLPQLAHCFGGVSERCPADTQHGGANPLSALNTWRYVLNNIKAAVHFAGVQVAPELLVAIAEVHAAITDFFVVPALDRFTPIVGSAMQIVEAVKPWLEQQRLHPAVVPISVASPVVALPSDGSGTPSSVTFPMAYGKAMPAVGFGTWKLEGSACYDAVKWALEAGIRHIDTAEAYYNEAEVGRALRDSGVPRADVFLTTKSTSVALGMAEPAFLEASFAGQLQALQTDYVDVYMLHANHPGGSEKLRAVWQEMERMHDLGRAKTLGVSNFGIKELEELWALARVKPAYVQNIHKVYKPGEQIHGGSATWLVDWARSHNVVVVGYSVINSWPHLLPPLEDPHVVAVAKAHGRTASQVLHRWALQQGVAVIPKASSRERIRENSMLFDFELSPVEMAVLDGLATLSESTNTQALPAWRPDIFNLR